MGAVRPVALTLWPIIYLVSLAKTQYAVSESANGSSMVNGCPAHFARWYPLCTMLTLQPMSWTDGEAVCAAQGAKLAYVKNNEQLKEFIQFTQSVKNLLIGLKYTISDKKWRWADGTEFNPATDWHFWMSGAAPKEPTRDACVVLRSDGTRIGWKAMSCSAIGMPVCFADATTSKSNCPPEFTQEGDLCLLPIMRPYNSPVKAALKCNGHGAFVASPKTAEEYASFLTLSQVVLSHLTASIWLGLKYNHLEDIWKWDDGSETNVSSTWMPWRNRPGTPDHDACVLVEKKPTGGFEWTLEDCRSEIGVVVCSTPIYIQPTPNTRANCPPDFIENGGMCAHTITNPLLNTWRQTEKTCVQFQSSILTIKSDFEWKALMAGAASQLSNAPAGVWLGLNYTKAEDKFHWFDGTEYNPAEEWGLWAHDEPGHPDRDKCALIEQTGEEERKFEWIMVDCESPHMMGIGICFSMAGTYDGN